MIEKEEIINRVLYLLTTSDKSLRKAVQNKLFTSFFEDDEDAQYIAEQFVNWFKAFDSLPSMQRIFEANKENSWGTKLKIRFKALVGIGKLDIPPSENEYDSLVNELKVMYAKKKFTQKLQGFSDVDSKIVSKDVGSFSDFLREFGKGFIEISNNLNTNDEGEYSYTTHDVQSNIGKILERDLSKEKRFKVGHRTIDDATKGFRYGDLMLVLGNINQGKSMVLVNMLYNLWKDGHNVLLLTAEMKPEEFDERIYSRASAVDYGKILSGKQYLEEPDRMALEECVKEMKAKDTHIITKFMEPTDNVATIEGYLNDLKITHNFIPDIIIFDSLEHISPLYMPAEEKDWQIKGQIIVEFKHWASTCLNGRGVFIISTHQAKTETHDKKFDEISITDFGRSKIVPEKADFAMYIRSIPELGLLNSKLIKARRCQAGLSWTMAIDYSKCLITNTEDQTSSSNLLLEDND
jgi:archaellum biogenesis ATPase FlaH